MSLLTGMSNSLNTFSGVEVSKAPSTPSRSSATEPKEKPTPFKSVLDKKTSEPTPQNQKADRGRTQERGSETSEKQNSASNDNSDSQKEYKAKSNTQQEKPVQAENNQVQEKQNHQSEGLEPIEKNPLKFSQEKIIGQIPTKSVSTEEENTLGPISDKLAVQKLSQRIDKLGFKMDEVVDPLTRRVAIQKFMRKMEDEFGIQPIDLVVAFNNLSTEDLVSPPAQTVPRVVEQFGLSPQQESKATVYFNQMLARSEAASLAEYLKGSERQLSLEVMSRSEISKNEVTESVAKLQNQFFVNPREAQKNSDKGPENLLASLSGKEALKMASQPASAAQTKAAVMEGPGALSAMNLNPQSSTQASESVSRAGIQSFDDMMGQLRLNMNKDSNGSMAAEATKSMNQNVSNSSLDAQAQGDSDFMSQSQGSSVPSIKATSLEGEALPELESTSFEGLLRAQNSQSLAQQGAQQVGKASMIMPGEPNTVEEAGNVREIISQSKMLIKQGGGEMTVRMTPEDLGEVSLKVDVKDGKVSVDVVTESNHAKKLIEKGLGELKATLASHKLDVEQIKVDIGNNLSQDLDQQQNEADRRFAQQFLQDFKQGNQSFREAFGFGRTIKTGDQLTDDQNTDIIAEVSKKKKSGKNRLDLVA